MKIRLIDTGYVGDGDLVNQTQLNDSDRAGFDGSTMQYFELDVQRISYNFDTNLNNKPVPNNTVGNRTTMISVTNPVLSISLVVNKELVTTNHQYNNLVTLTKFAKTRGLKLLYPSVTTDVKKTVIEALGAVNTGTSSFSSDTPSVANGTVSSTTPHLIGFVRSPSITDTQSSNLFTISFGFVLYE
jgi:hypothetical protein